MKKIITVSVIMAIILGLSIAETAIGQKVYGKIEEDCLVMSKMLEGREDNVKNDKDLIKRADDLIDYWSEYYQYLMTLSNHTTIKNFNEKVNSIKAYILVDAAEDAYVATVSVMGTAKDLKDENMPFLENLL